MPTILFIKHFFKYLGCTALTVIIGSFIFTPVGGIVILILCAIMIIPMSIQDTKKSIQKIEDDAIAAKFEKDFGDFDFDNFDKE